MQSKCVCVCFFCHILIVSVSRGGVLLRQPVCWLRHILGRFSYSSLIVPSNCSCLILVCHFLCLFRANSKSWIGWQTKETGWHWAVRVMPSHLLLWCFQAGAKWAREEKKKNKNPIAIHANCLLEYLYFPRSWYQLTKHKIVSVCIFSSGRLRALAHD